MYLATGGLYFVLLLFSAVHMLNLFQKDANNFGAYTPSWPRYELCKGPKTRNVTFVSTNVTEVGNYSLGYYNFTFLAESKFEEVKIVVYSLKGDSKSLLWTYKISDPCSHFAFSSVIENFIKSHNCVVKKGIHSVSLNFNEICNAFLGSTFFYGDFMFKITVTSKQENIMCLIVVVKITKKVEVKI